jgi:hypothetical protein
MPLADETPIPGPIPKPADSPGPLQRYRVAFDDGTIELHEGHAVSQPRDGIWRIHRCNDGVWQMVFGGRSELIRTIRAISSMEYDQLLRAQAKLNIALDHIGVLLVFQDKPCMFNPSTAYCTTHPLLVAKPFECAVATAREFVAELRPF